jgi:hypothetical protein
VTADRTKITEERTRSRLLTESLLRFPHASHECLGEFGGDLLSKSFGKTCEYSRYFPVLRNFHNCGAVCSFSVLIEW